MGSLDPLPEMTRTPPQVSRFLLITAPFTGPNMKSQLDSILDDGWDLNGIYVINSNNFAVFTRPKRQP